MTRDEVLVLKPGRELDALVAEYVVGMKEHRKAYPESFDERVIWFRNPPNVTAYYVPFYSTDISAAWEVLEKMGGFTLVPAGRNIHGKISFWYAGKKYIEGNHVYEVNDARNPTTGCGETAPEAICKAALLAVMDGEDEHERD